MEEVMEEKPVSFISLREKQLFSNTSADQFAKGTLINENIIVCELCEEGSTLVAASPSELYVYKHDNEHEGQWILTQSFKTEHQVQHIDISTGGSFITTWHYIPRLNKGNPEPDPNALGNLIIYDIRGAAVTGSPSITIAPPIVLREKYPNMVKHLWPYYKFTTDEKFVAVLKQSVIYVYTTDAIGQRPPFAQHRNAGIKQFCFKTMSNHQKGDNAGEQKYMIGTFTPQVKDKFAIVQLYHLDDLRQVVMTKSFGRGEHVEFLWNSSGSAVIIKAFSAIDQSNRSYSGTYDCYYMKHGGSQQINVTIRPKREGNIHDVSWDVYGRRYVVVYGSQPASATLYNLKGNAVAELGASARNAVYFSPSGYLCALAGFGSLKGQIQIWDHKGVRLGGLAESFAASLLSWSASSQYFLTAVLQDRMKVDNVIRIFKYDGTLVTEIGKDDKLLYYKVFWRTAKWGEYPSIPPDERIFAAAKKKEAEAKAAPKVARYVPPGQRARVAAGGGGGLAGQMMRDMRGNHNVVGRVDNSSGTSKMQSKEGPPSNHGAEKSKAAERNRRRREAKRKQREEAERLEAEAKKDTPVPVQKQDPAKRLKRVQKKLRQIDGLLLRQKNGEELNEAQISKVSELEELKEVAAQLSKELGK